MTASYKAEFSLNGTYIGEDHGCRVLFLVNPLLASLASANLPAALLFLHATVGCSDFNPCPRARLRYSPLILSVLRIVCSCLRKTHGGTHSTRHGLAHFRHRDVTPGTLVQVNRSLRPHPRLFPVPLFPTLPKQWGKSSRTRTIWDPHTRPECSQWPCGIQRGYKARNSPIYETTHLLQPHEE